MRSRVRIKWYEKVMMIIFCAIIIIFVNLHISFKGRGNKKNKIIQTIKLNLEKKWKTKLFQVNSWYFFL